MYPLIRVCIYVCIYIFTCICIYTYVYIYVCNHVGMCIDDHHSRVRCARVSSLHIRFILSICLSIFYVRVSVPASSPGPGARTTGGRTSSLCTHIHTHTHVYIFLSLSFIMFGAYAHTQSPIVVLPPPCFRGRASRSDCKGPRERTKGPHCDVSPARLKTASTTRAFVLRAGEGARLVRACVRACILYISPRFFLRSVSPCNLVFEEGQERGKKLIKPTGASAGPYFFIRCRDQQRERDNGRILSPRFPLLPRTILYPEGRNALS